ncbi:uncharacterized protein LOC108912283 isoform X2 [Anoplophora glabripennis]|uniref:uncharacterized protein LOC108912283 isoform X2 n=1 Tax=Anoplophora glabripennis TaxID=217634 RepID=UPI000873A629|nr:uncharacterized protein LOC108912283 isoform X2 [Anoplophora glabripennis]
METVTQRQKTWTLGANEEHEDLIYSFITEMKKINGHKSTFKEEELVMVCLDTSLLIKTRSVPYVEAVLLEEVLSCGFNYRAQEGAAGHDFGRVQYFPAKRFTKIRHRYNTSRLRRFFLDTASVLTLKKQQQKIQLFQFSRL